MTGVQFKVEYQSVFSRLKSAALRPVSLDLHPITMSGMWSLHEARNKFSVVVEAGRVAEVCLAAWRCGRRHGAPEDSPHESCGLEWRATLACGPLAASFGKSVIVEKTKIQHKV